MSTINQSVSKCRSVLLNPRENAPTIDQIFTLLGYEFQNFYNESSNSSIPWTYNTVTINVNNAQIDYLVPAGLGKVLFATAYPQDSNWGPVSLEIADLADVTSDFFLYSPLDFGYSRDFNETWQMPFPFQIAFYVKDGDLYFRLAPFPYAINSVTLTYATGDWLQNLSVNNTAVLSQHHALIETRTALNLLPACEWTDKADADDRKRNNLAQSLLVQENRYRRAWEVAKRNIGGDAVTERSVFGEDWY